MRFPPSAAGAVGPESLPAHDVAQPPSAHKTHSDSLFDGRVPFEVRLLYAVFVLLSVPMFMMLAVDAKPSVAYWNGSRAFNIVSALMGWVLFCHILVMLRRVSRVTAVIVALVFPSFVCTFVCQTQAWRLSQVASELQATDCGTFAQKAALEKSWQAAKDLKQRCLETRQGFTGAPEDEVVMVLNLEACPEYVQASDQQKRDWQYLRYVEDKYVCGGWCSADEPVWQWGRMRDSCSVAVSSVLTEGSVFRAIQISFYSAVLLCSVGIMVLMMPEQIELHSSSWIVA